MTLTALDISKALVRREREALAALDELESCARAMAEADRDYKRDWAATYLQAEGSIKAREAVADIECSELRFESKLAEGLFKSALEAARTKRDLVSSGQTSAAAYKAEMELAKSGPMS